MVNLWLIHGLLMVSKSPDTPRWFQYFPGRRGIDTAPNTKIMYKLHQVTWIVNQFSITCFRACYPLSSFINRSGWAKLRGPGPTITLPSGGKGLVNETRQGGRSKVGVFLLIGGLALACRLRLRAAETDESSPTRSTGAFQPLEAMASNLLCWNPTREITAGKLRIEFQQLHPTIHSWIHHQFTHFL